MPDGDQIMTITNQQKQDLIDQFERSFHTVQLMRVWVDEETHAVNVKAHEIRLHVKHEIPVKMGLVTGHFYCEGCELTSLMNAPHTVWGNFACYNNKLTNLKHGPQSVGDAQVGGGTYSCSYNPLTNFEGAPEHFEGYFVAAQRPVTNVLTSVDGAPTNARLMDIMFKPDLPMLKLLKQKQVNIRDPEQGDLMQPLTNILNDHAGSGKAKAIACAARLVKAGYKDNARW
jgi:hypothetical protein